jgi:uncharacterized membrane protein
MNKHFLALTFLSLLGLADAGFLTVEKLSNKVPPCPLNGVFTDCGKVLTSPQSVILGIPVPVLGMIFYGVVFFIVMLLLAKENKLIHFLSLFSIMGIFFSFYFVFLQIFIIRSICMYCMLSAINTFFIFFIVRDYLHKKAVKLEYKVPLTYR